MNTSKSRIRYKQIKTIVLFGMDKDSRYDFAYHFAVQFTDGNLDYSQKVKISGFKAT